MLEDFTIVSFEQWVALLSLRIIFYGAAAWCCTYGDYLQKSLYTRVCACTGVTYIHDAIIADQTAELKKR